MECLSDIGIDVVDVYKKENCEISIDEMCLIYYSNLEKFQLCRLCEAQKFAVLILLRSLNFMISYVHSRIEYNENSKNTEVSLSISERSNIVNYGFKFREYVVVDYSRNLFQTYTRMNRDDYKYKILKQKI